MDLSPDTDAQTPPLSLPIKPLSYANGTLNHHRYPSPPPHTAVIYKECLRNHAATRGGHALDGCGEFMPSITSTQTDPTSLKCAACGCHRNFHRRDSVDDTTYEIHHHHRTHPNSPPPQPVAAAVAEPSQLFSSAPHMLMALKTGSGGINGNGNHQTTGMAEENLSGRKRFRTKFSQEQKEKMYRFSEKLGWKLLRSEEALVEEFCNEIGVGRGKLKVWMHNNKHTLGKKLSDDNGKFIVETNGNSNVNGDDNHITDNNNYNHLHRQDHDQDQIHGSSPNGSSSSGL